MVSVFGGLLVVAAGFVYWSTSGPGWAVAGMALHLSWHVVDGADGDLARITGKTSPLGELVDGICDYVSHIVLYVLLAFVLTREIGPAWAWFWTLSAGASHIVQANHVEVQRRFYQYWTYGVPWLHNSNGGDRTLFRESGGIGWLLRVIVAGYLRLAAGMSPNALRIDAGVTRAMADDPALLAQIRTQVQREQRPLLSLLRYLGPNPRAVLLGISMIAGSPLWYFLYLSIALNLLLALSVRLHDAAAGRVVARLGLA
jgi:phosphatidylglycerophosphate synthase